MNGRSVLALCELNFVMLVGLRFNVSALLRFVDWQVAPDISKKPIVCLSLSVTVYQSAWRNIQKT